MKTVIIGIALLALVGCSTGLGFVYRSLGATRDTLEETKTALSEMQTQTHEMQLQQQKTLSILEDTQNELQETTKDLEETDRHLEDNRQDLEDTRQDLYEQIEQTEEYVSLYESTVEELDDKKQELDIVSERIAELQQINQERQDIIDDIQQQLDLYQDTLGTQVFSDITPPYNTGYLSDLTLTNNSTAENPSWEQLLDFLRKDKTDKNLYVDDVYMCGSFAEDLHNNAEAKGIRAAFVAVHFDTGLPHAVNAFKTTDKDLVYIDVTGTKVHISLASLDKRVEMAKDELYRHYLLFPDVYWNLSQDTRTVENIEIYW
jgi:gas vesicle protein